MTQLPPQACCDGIITFPKIYFNIIGLGGGLGGQNNNTVLSIHTSLT